MRFETLLIPAMRTINRHPWLNRLVFARDPWGNPFSDEMTADPFPMVERMWEGGEPLIHRKAYQRWFAIGYEECQLLANHPDASAGATLDDMFEDVPPFSRLNDDTKTFFRNWMLLRDGETHTRLRKLVSRTFTPRQVAGWEPIVQGIVDELLDRVETRDRVEMFEAFNRPLPVNVISSILGFPRDQWPWVGDIVARMAGFLDPLNTFSVDQIDGAVAEFRVAVLELAALRLSDPADDLITALARAEHDGDRLTEDELVANVGLLVFAGHDTTTHMLGLAMIALAQHPDQRTLVRQRPELWPNAVDELLRYDSTVASINRKLSAAIEVGGQTLPAGANVTLQLNAANRDPRRWHEPCELRLDRPDPRPISFGHGLHHCLGHALARTELRIGLAAFVERFGDYTIEPDSIEWRRSVLLRGPDRLVVRRG